MEAGSAIERVQRTYVAAAAVLVVLNVADVVLTRAAIAAGASELNPISRSFIEHGALAYGIKFSGVDPGSWTRVCVSQAAWSAA